MRLCFWCLKEYEPVKRHQGGGLSQNYCSPKCREASFRDLHRVQIRAKHKLYMRVYRANAQPRSL